MAVLASLAAAIQRIWSQSREPVTFSKAELRQAMSDVDAWIDANMTSFNTSLNAGFRAKATATQKALLLVYITAKRAGLRSGGE